MTNFWKNRENMGHTVKQNFIDWNTAAATRPYTWQGTPEREAEFQAARSRVTHRAEWQEPLPNCRKPHHTPSLTEQSGGRDSDNADDLAEQYCRAIREYLDSDRDMGADAAYKRMRSIMSLKVVVPGLFN